MIYIERPPLDPDLKLLTQAASETKRLLGEYQELRAAFRDAFEPRIWLGFREALQELFGGKCAYCESPVVASGNAVIEHFRPKRDAARDRATAAPEYYFWLAYEWRNLLIACHMCNAAKRNTFPVVDDKRGEIGSAWETIVASEKNLILDPCRDHPENFLEFQEDGRVLAKPLRHSQLQPYGGEHPGEVTIRVLNLNRDALIAARREHALNLNLGMRAGDSWVQRMLAPQSPYLALTRAMLGLDQNERRSRTIQGVTTPRAATVPELSSPALQPPLIEKVEIRNFKLIESLDLSLGGGSLAILGENAVGKSTVLRAIALAFLGEARVVERFGSGSPLLRRVDGDQLAESGSIRIQFALTHEPVEMGFDRDSIRFKSGRDGLAGYCRAYGNVRIPSESLAGEPGNLSVDNLFDPRAEITNAGEWLKQVPKEARERVGVALRRILMLRDEDAIEFGDDGFRIRLDGTWSAVGELSSGYQDIFHILADVMRGFGEDLTNFENATGIVLIDELGNSLHPKWKMQIVPLLRDVFPQVQAIFTTHDPLCLKGFQSSEIVVLSKDRRSRRVVAKRARTPLRTLRVDQILTSELFGLSSTIDPEAQSAFDAYYELLAKGGDLTDDDRVKREKLRRELAGLSNLPASLRDQKIFDLMDEFLARREAWEVEGGQKLDEEEAKVRRAVYDRWLHLTGEKS